MSIGKINSPQLMFASSAESLISWYQAQHTSPDVGVYGHDEGESKKKMDRAEEDAAITSRPRVSSLSFACRRAGDTDDASPLLLVIGVKTATGHFDKRQAVRETWMGTDLGPSFTGRVCLQFITGSPGPELSIETTAALRLEASIYGDLLLGV